MIQPREPLRFGEERIHLGVAFNRWRAVVVQPFGANAGPRRRQLVPFPFEVLLLESAVAQQAALSGDLPTIVKSLAVLPKEAIPEHFLRNDVAPAAAEIVHAVVVNRP